VSQENVEVARAGYAAYNKAVQSGDFLPLFREFLDPEVEYEPVEESGVVRGYEDLLQYLGRWHERWDDFHWEVQEIMDAGDHVVVIGRISARGKKGGVEVGQRFFAVHTFRNGRSVRLREYLDRQDALDAVGLRE
jgi:ketosteroid isomerase-like protein